MNGDKKKEYTRHWLLYLLSLSLFIKKKKKTLYFENF